MSKKLSRRFGVEDVDDLNYSKSPGVTEEEIARADAMISEMGLVPVRKK